MKKLLLSKSLFTVIATRAQPYTSFTATTKNVGLSIGYLEQPSGIELTTGYNVFLEQTGHGFLMDRWAKEFC